MTQQAKEHQAIKASWWQTFRQQGYYFKWLAIGVILTGIFLHATCLVIGRDLFHENDSEGSPISHGEILRFAQNNRSGVIIFIPG